MFQVHQNLLDDYDALLPPETPQLQRAGHRGVAGALLSFARSLLDAEPADADPLLFWPQNAALGALFPLAKLLFAIPASSADNERAFSSAGFTMGIRRSRLELEAFRAEHRIRRFMVSCADGQSQQGRQKRLDRLSVLLTHYSSLIEERRAAAAAEDA